LLTVVIRGTNGFDKRYVRSKGRQSAIPKIVGQRLLRTYERLMNGGEREWSLTEAQKERLGEHLETEYGTLIGLLGDNFHSAVVRMAVQIERMALILSAMRGNLSEGTDTDYETAELIGSKMLMHMAMAYRMIKGDEQETMPKVKGLDQRKVVFDGLKARYQLNDLIKEAQSQGVSRSSAIRWNNQWIEKGMVRKENHGEYRKVA
jgi:hypothetical protein